MEALDDDDEMSQICIYCGIIPEMVLGDGGEDICCRLESQHLAVDKDFDGSFPADYVDTFLNNLKCFFIEGLVFPRKHMDDRLGWSFNLQS